MNIAANQTEDYFELIDRMVAQGGPRAADYADLNCWMARLDRAVTSGKLSRDALPVIRRHFGDALSVATLQGFALVKPHGYAGDFEIIDRIYQKCASFVPHLRAWDTFWQSHAAPVAVRNRKTYFHRLLDAHSRRCQSLRVLNVASGPGRCMFEWLEAHPQAAVTFDCVEIDLKAIEYAAELTRTFCHRISFIHKNALHFRPAHQYDLIWSAGLFDYFDDRLFRVALRRLLPAIARGGELVIGNFSHFNPSKEWMAFSEWILHQRTGDQLSTLAQECGVILSRVFVGQEPQGVNLFLHIRSDSGPPSNQITQSTAGRGFDTYCVDYARSRHLCAMKKKIRLRNHTRSSDNERVVKENQNQRRQSSEQAALTPREREILHWVAEGKRDGEIATILNLSVRTVEQHVRSCLKKLNVETRTAACAIVWRERKSAG